MLELWAARYLLPVVYLQWWCHHRHAHRHLTFEGSSPLVSSDPSCNLLQLSYVCLHLSPTPSTCAYVEVEGLNERS